MSWNGSNGASAPKQKPVNGARAVSNGALAGVIVVLGAAAALYFLMPASAPAPTAPAPKESSRAIEEASAHGTVKKSTVEDNVVEEKPLPPQRVGEVRDGYRLLPSGRLHKVTGVVVTGNERNSFLEKIFQHDSDCMLADLLTMEFGVGMIGDSESTFHNFDKAFVKSLKDPIVIDQEDTDYIRELKNGVRNLRADLEKRMNAGEDICKVLASTRDQMQQLALYREDLEAQVINLSEDDMNQQDYEDLVAAANKMLEDRGCMPMEIPATIKHAIRIKKTMALANEKEGEINE